MIEVIFFVPTTIKNLCYLTTIYENFIKINKAFTLHKIL